MDRDKDGQPLLQIITGKSRFDTQWKAVSVTWPKLVSRLSKSRKTRETHAEYMDLPKDRQDKIKDIGGFMGGTLVEGGRRNAENVKSRSLITLDADHAPADLGARLDALPECAACIYSTHKHTPEAPRLRVIIPLDREVTPDEHSAISRKVAGLIGLEYFDPASFKICQLMYWPSHSADVKPYFWHRDKAFLPADTVLEMYEDWTDPGEWPQLPGENPRAATGQKMADPRTKEGPVGDFCRAYTITEAIQAFLPEIYLPTDKEDRWTYAAGSTTGGLVIYDGDTFATSYHATDPAGGQSCNAFDLVRIHLFGKRDRPGEEYGRRTSDALMSGLVGEDPKVQAVRVEQAREAFQEAAEDDGAEEEGSGSGAPAEGSYAWKLQFHRFTKGNRPIDVIDAKIARHVIRNNRLMVIEGEPYYYQDGVYHYDKRGVHLRALVKACMLDDVKTDPRADRVYRLIISEEALQHDADDLNRHPKSWINCRNGMLDLKTLQLHDHSPEYFSLNQIPFSWDPGYRPPAKSITEDFLAAFLPDQDDREMFLEYAGYCMSTYTGFQKYLILSGKGGIGKSVLLKMVNWIVGEENLISIKLQALSGRFSSRFLQGKLLNSCGDLSSEAMTDTGMLKMIVGEDQVPAEIKGGAMFHFRPYAKLLFSANRIPISRDEQSNALYRRLMILRIEKRCREFPDLEDRLQEDSEAFFHMAVQAAHKAFQRGSLLESRRSREEVLDLYLRTDSVMAFLHYKTERDPDARIATTEAYNAYMAYCNTTERPCLSRSGFRANLREKGISVRTIHGAEYFAGLKLAGPDYEPPAASWDYMKD